MVIDCIMIFQIIFLQLLYHSGLFHSGEMELHLWMDWLIKFVQEDSRGRNEELLKFVSTVFTQYICNPYPYIEKVLEFISEASVFEVGSDNCGDLVSMSTIDDFIDSKLLILINSFFILCVCGSYIIRGGNPRDRSIQHTVLKNLFI